MTDSLRTSTTRCPPLRQARGTVLNTIMEDTGEALAEKGAGRLPLVKPALPSPKLTLKTSGLSAPAHARLARLMSPLSACTDSSCCSDTEWQQQQKEQMQQIQGYDDLYDATDDGETDDDTATDVSDSCFSAPGTQRSSLVTPITRHSITSTGSRKRDLSLDIPSPVWPAKTSMPPTPPPKIPLSPAALSLLGRSVPACHAPPSLDGSLTSDQESHLSGLATPDTRSLPDTNWDAQEIRVRTDMDLSDSEQLTAEEGSPDLQSFPMAIESPGDDWRNVLERFPSIPKGQEDSTPTRESTFDIPSREPTPSDQGVSLPDGALAMLHHLPVDQPLEPWSATSESNDEMWQLQAPPTRPRSAEGLTPASEMSGYSFSELSIPSPGGFFASLGSRARHTWSIPKDTATPSSATAEGFYNFPLPGDRGEVIEQVISWPDRSQQEEDPITAVRIEDGPPTARQVPAQTPTRLPPQTPTRRPPPTPTRIVTHQDGFKCQDGNSPVKEITPVEAAPEYDELYDTELRSRAAAGIDRTSTWLAAQASYLSALHETNPVNDTEPRTASTFSETETEGDDTEGEQQKDLATLKPVRYSEGVPECPSPRPSVTASKDSIYWRGFKSIRDRSSEEDGFLHRTMRFDAIQSFRLGMEDMHINCLMGKYEVVRPERPAYKGPFSQAPRNSVLTSSLAEKAQFSNLEKEQLVLAQLCRPMWAMEALRCLNGGKLLTSPATKRMERIQSTAKKQEGEKTRTVRILDLGGQASCEWGWHAAQEYPGAKVYSVVPKSQNVNKAIKGPPNHRVVSVAQLWDLPFGANKFDVISTRSLHALLKTSCPAGSGQDEYDLVLQECMRCLKPGGYIEFMVLDAEISRAGSYGSATSVEFAFNLRARGYDPLASKSFLSRLRQRGFVDMKRAWMYLPMGVESDEMRALNKLEGRAPAPNHTGSTEDVASVTGVLGGWMWEQWLLSLRTEMGRDRTKLLEGVSVVFDEGRNNGAGWTCLSGWAMKPKPAKQSARG
ncbi:hypothetical protein N7462_000831 [Penicillium macrosclerotiorum]|uniref:uncharacterized protein n=1 Tax=Penicillium macrosclerotiorum TaxID=303699 RepID=UPI0025487411|nr:uncharacterized protein N7462_000831 [Penicillium macrosclerotiorum]KAJ5698826.1 hypothetical protein N7462_000831 [Penicillium macrosclerotiorum]